MYKAGATSDDINAKFGLKKHTLGTIIGKLRKAGANIPRPRSTTGIDFKALAEKVNSMN